MRHNLMRYWWRGFYIALLVLIAIVVKTGADGWGWPFLAGIMVAGFGYQIAHRVTYGTWFE